MKKSILIVTVLSAWFFVKNSEYAQLVTMNKTGFRKKAALLTQEVKKDLFQFTTVHLHTAKKKTNNSKHKTQSCLLQATNGKHLHNHEPLLIVNGL